MGSSTATIGNGEPPENSQSRFTQVMRRSRGSFSFGTRLKELGENFVPHHGQVSRGMGDVFWSCLNFRVRARAVFSSRSPDLPMRLGVAAWPTQSPISNGHLPSFSTSFRRSSSTVSYTHLRAHETRHDLVCRL